MYTLSSSCSRTSHSTAHKIGTITSCRKALRGHTATCTGRCKCEMRHEQEPSMMCCVFPGNARTASAHACLHCSGRVQGACRWKWRDRLLAPATHAVLLPFQL